MQQHDLPLIIKKIICSFTSERTAQIKINDTIGPKFQLKSGVPQGSILSPSLYIFYTHDLPPGVISFISFVMQILFELFAHRRHFVHKERFILCTFQLCVLSSLCA